jgi:glycosyltransferase involved in cell wall biosynthesis
LLAEAVADFAGQTLIERELLIVHDGDASLVTALDQLIAPYLAQGLAIRVLAALPGTPLGGLRNLSVDKARGDYLCQWDDDDRYHPRRLEIQWQALVEQQADFCFLCDQLHLFKNSGRLFWDDWYGDSWPLNVIQGTLLGRRELMPRYPGARRGEDTGATLDLLRAGRQVARVRGAGWCYVYVCHGANAWEDGHHQAIAQAKAWDWSRLMGKEALLRQRLAEYRPPVSAAAPLVMTCADEMWRF